MTGSDHIKNNRLRQEAMRRFNTAATKFLRDMALSVEVEAKKSMSGPAPSPIGNPPAVRTGYFRRSITHEIDPVAMRARVGTNIKYARIHEFGGIIRPKKAKWLVFDINRGLGKPPEIIKTKRVQIPPRPTLGPALNRVMATVYPKLRQKFMRA